MKMIISIVRTRTVDIAETTSASMVRAFITRLINIPLMLVAKYAEILLKARQTRSRMEAVLIANVSAALKSAGAAGFKIRKEGGLLLIEASGEERLVAPLAHVFGINSVSICSQVPADAPSICRECVSTARAFPAGSSFAVRARRAGEHPFTSQQLAAECGAMVLGAFPEKNLKVNLSSPDSEIFVDARPKAALVSSKIFQGPGGLPVGSQGTAVCLADGSFNSLLAAWLVAKRGLRPIFLVRKGNGNAATDALAPWLPGMEMEIHSSGQPASKRQMLETACSLAQETGANCVVAGDVFSDISAEGVLRSLDTGLPVPVFRPLVGFSDEMLARYIARAGFGGKAV